MSVLDLSLTGFIIIETFNVLSLFFFPEFKYANGIAIFSALEKSKKDKEISNIIKYLTYWVASSKVIFIFLLTLILFSSDINFKANAALILSLGISIFYLKLFPLIRKMDRNNEITPSGYSKVLVAIILSFIVIIAGSAISILLT